MAKCQWTYSRLDGVTLPGAFYLGAMKKGSKLHKMHAILDRCERCGMDAYDASVSNCLTDGEIAERKAWRDEAEKAAEAFARTTKVR